MPTVKELWAATAPDKKLAPPPAAPDATHPADESYSPPVSTVKLPSGGICYPPESPLYMVDSVDIKAVTAKEENILASPVLIKNGKVLTTLMRACITNRALDPEEMLIGDKNAILIAIRVSAYGPEYACEVTCPNCAEETDASFNLSKLNLNSLSVQPTEPGRNEFEFTLPATSRKVWFRLLDVGSSAALSKDMDAVRKKTGQDMGITMRLKSQVLRIQGCEDAKAVSVAIDNMAARDSRALRAYMDKVSPDVDMEQEFECKSCGSKSEVDIPLGMGFFWPAAE